MNARQWPLRTQALTVVCAALVLSFLAAFACSSTSAPASSSMPTAPGPDPSTIPNLAGEWTGTIESEAFATRPISASIVQSVDCVDGAWKTSPVGWSGAISGFAMPNSFSGFISIEGSVGGSGLCGGVGRATGSASPTAIKWTLNNDGNCAGGVAQTVVFKLHR